MHEALLQLVGETVGEGRFRLDRVLDQGGMGAVFAGIEVATGRTVAVKLMHPGLGAEDEYLARFRREAEVTTLLAHPHVVDVIATGGGGGAPPFIAMELLEGASLKDRMKSGEAFDVIRTVKIARQVLSALGVGHDLGVVHRDLKPANVMLVDGPSGQVAKVVDFGVARLAMTEAMTRLTATGQVVGTPAYMAPEQAMGAPADARADLFAVGAVMHHLLVGDPPFGKGNYAKLLSRIVADERERIHTRAPGLGPVSDVIERALAYEPEDRFQSAAEMDRALAALDATPTATILDWRPPVDLATLRLSAPPEAIAPPPAPQISPAPTPPRRGGALRAILLVAGALVLGVVGTWFAFAPDDVTPRELPEGAAAAPETVSPAQPPAPVMPVALQPADVGVDAAEATSEPVPAQHSRHRRRTVTAYVSGGRGGSTPRLHLIMEAVRRSHDWTSCFPAEGRLSVGVGRGTDFNLVLTPEGRVASAVHVGADRYPEFNACVTRHLVGIQVEGQNLEGPFRLSFGLRDSTLR